MKLRPSLKNRVRAVPRRVSLCWCIFLLSLILVSLFGCTSFEPSYKEEEIPAVVSRLCKEEYDLDVVTKRVGQTLWIYVPTRRILQMDSEEEVRFDEEFAETLRRVLTSVGRVILSADRAPEFYVLVASDTQEIGLDYMLVGYALDIKKSYAQYIPWTEAHRRYVRAFAVNPEALGDNQGSHLNYYDVALSDFLALQIAQRAGMRFEEQNLKESLSVNALDGKYRDGVFRFTFDASDYESKEMEIISNEIFDIASYVLKSYEFEEFHLMEVVNANTMEEIVLNRNALFSFRRKE